MSVKRQAKRSRGISEMKKVPDLVFVTDTNYESRQFRVANLEFQ